MAAMRSAKTAKLAASRLTLASAASDSKPTEPVHHHASNFSAMVDSAAATDSQAYRLSDGFSEDIFRFRQNGRDNAGQALAHLDRRGDQLPTGELIAAQRPPLIEKNFDRFPHRNPTQNADASAR